MLETTAETTCQPMTVSYSAEGGELTDLRVESGN
jgi:hypothetical protein